MITCVIIKINFISVCGFLQGHVGIHCFDEVVVDGGNSKYIRYEVVSFGVKPCSRENIKKIIVVDSRHEILIDQLDVVCAI